MVYLTCRGNTYITKGLLFHSVMASCQAASRAVSAQKESPASRWGGDGGKATVAQPRRGEYRGAGFELSLWGSFVTAGEAVTGSVASALQLECTTGWGRLASGRNLSSMSH